MSMGSNTIAAADLMSFVERIERLEADKSEIIDDIRAVYAEAKATGFVPKYVRKIVKRRSEKPADVQEDEALTDIYLNAAGLAKETPLFRHVGAMAVDRNARSQVIAALRDLCPDGGEIVVKIAGHGVRLWRDKFANAPAMRERFRVLTWSAAHLYQTFAADALHRHTAERITGVTLADLGEQIVAAIEVLEYAPGRRT